MRVPGVGGPRQVITAAVAALAERGLTVVQVSPVIDSAPLGPSRRRYGNAVMTVHSALSPSALLSVLQAVEHEFGRRRRGSRWRARPLDLDIVLWGGGRRDCDRLTIPHPEYRNRAFVLGPAAAIAGEWRDPVSGASLRHLHARLTRPRPLPRCRRSHAIGGP